MNKSFYNKTLSKGLDKNRDFLVKHFENEWDLIQKKERNRGRTEKLKSGGAAIGKALLGLLAIGGALTVAMVAPNVFVIFDRRNKRRVFLEKDDFEKNKRNFQKQKLVTFEQKDEATYQIYLTIKGEKRALGEIYENLGFDNKQKQWDKIWRVVIFDIPEKHKNARDGFRWKIKQMGFYRLQDSVFVAPYPCEKEINFLTSIFNINRYVHVFTTGYLKNEGELKKYFNITF